MVSKFKLKDLPKEELKVVGLVIVVSLFVFFGCMDSSVINEAGGDIRGDIIAISQAGSSVLIESIEDNDKASVIVTDKTDIFKLEGGKLHRMRYDDLKVGQQVEVWFTGPVMQTYPRRATARKIVIL